MKRILLVNTLPLLVLVVTLLYLNQFQNSLLETEVNVLRSQAKIYTGALSHGAIKKIKEDDWNERLFNPQHLFRLIPEKDNGKLLSSDQSLSIELAKPLLISLTNPSPNVHAKLFNMRGEVVADSEKDRREKDFQQAKMRALQKKKKEYDSAFPMFAEDSIGFSIRYDNMLEQVYDHLIGWLPYVNSRDIKYLEVNVDPDVIPEQEMPFQFSTSFHNYEPPAYIRRTADYRLLITVFEPIVYHDKIIGVIQLTREAQDIDHALFSVRASILVIFLLALTLTVILSWYLSLTIAKPLIHLANLAYNMHKSIGENKMVPDYLLIRRDEIGDLAKALQGSAKALWAKMEAIERFAADVSHELKNPLSSIRSAIELLPQIRDDEHRKRLLFIITDDVRRLDRLITDIASSSRIETEMSRLTPTPVAVLPIFQLLAEMNAATHEGNDPVLVVGHKEQTIDSALKVLAIEDRLVQVLRNLIGNASSFSPPKGKITLSAVSINNKVEIMVADEGPGIPENRLDSIFERFYTERPEKENFGQHSGLGLSICRQIVIALKGSIRANNRYDLSGNVMGAVFIVTLPKA